MKLKFVKDKKKALFTVILILSTLGLLLTTFLPLLSPLLF